MRSPSRSLSLLILALGALVGLPTRLSAEKPQKHHVLVAVPEEDRFLPFSLVIRSGDTVD